MTSPPTFDSELSLAHSRGGAKLTEQGVASEYSVARPTVRSAVDQLARDGLVFRQPHLPPQVVEVPHEEIPEILSLLETIERLALENLAQRPHAARAVHSVVGGSLHNALGSMVTELGSDRLAALHRRLTFELILGSRDLSAPFDEASSPAAEIDVVESIGRGDPSGGFLGGSIRRARTAGIAPGSNRHPGKCSQALTRGSNLTNGTRRRAPMPAGRYGSRSARGDRGHITSHSPLDRPCTHGRLVVRIFGATLESVEQ